MYCFESPFVVQNNVLNLFWKEEMSHYTVLLQPHKLEVSVATLQRLCR